VTDTTDKETNERTNKRTGEETRRVSSSVRPSVRLFLRLRNDLYCVEWALNSTHSLRPSLRWSLTHSDAATMLQLFQWRLLRPCSACTVAETVPPAHPLKVDLHQPTVILTSFSGRRRIMPSQTKTRTLRHQCTQQ